MKRKSMRIFLPQAFLKITQCLNDSVAQESADAEYGLRKLLNVLRKAKSQVQCRSCKGQRSKQVKLQARLEAIEVARADFFV